MRVLFYAFLIIILNSCASAIPKIIENGDFIFVEAENKNLSGAISRVTENNQIISFDHIAIVEKDKNKFYILEASVKNGSHKMKLKNFLANNKQTKLVLYRLKTDYKFSIPDAIIKANSLLGKPYNSTYILNENSYYCSDFIERRFRNANIFELNPMTFINPKTGKTDEFWQSFYEKLNVEVPEGKLGCNPNGLSQSTKIEKIIVLN